MAAFKVLLFLAAAVACTYAEEAERVKKDVVVGAYPYYGVQAYSYGYDDGKYYPGKYEKPTVYSAAPVAYTAGAYPYAAAAYPYTAGAYPYAYGAYPYSYGAYPYFAGKHVVY